ncbi:Na+/H+ antiporter NhaC family protein [Clostridium tyrobutyricum]|uniref:Na+/H+ antiporter NhaC family protein n=1 Tax=Clostridium tyrobutyricum TaxID=1519 RepID=UPI002B2138EB|nr:Na+/H+ antiporter NhaC family protein [Clostridium tyrobutyricum]MEA5009056.1 Na+/H+ antiporter NhaC family protein [Clostridium tyrobutyricum]
MTWLSLIPAVITIILTFKTKKLIISLFIGVLAGTLISKGPLGGITAIGEYMMDAIADKESAYTLSFLIAFGSLAELIEMGGGISGFSQKVSKWAKNEKGVLGWAWLLSIITFFDSSFHTIAVGTVLTPILNKVKGSKEKFAFILSITSLQLILLIPIATAYLGYMVTLVTNNIKGKGITENAYALVAKSVFWNLFSWIMILISIGVTLFGLGFGKIKIGKSKEEKEEFTKAHIEKEELLEGSVEEYPKNSRNLIVPVSILLISTIFFFWWTGKDKASSFFGALSSAQFSVSIFSGVIFTLLLTTLYFMLQKISLAEIETHIVTGGEKVLSLVIILILSWALTSVTQDLGFNNLISGSLVQSIPKFLIPAILFLISGIISYTIGSSWATWALMMTLAVNFSINSGINIAVMIGTVWAGGAVSDIISPLSAQMSDTSFGNHLTTSFPYLIAGVVITTIAYVVVGFFT